MIAESFATSLSPQTYPEKLNTQGQAEFSPSAGGITGSAESRYVCGDGIDGDESNVTIEVTYDYDLYTKVGMSVGEALRDVKESILSDIAGRVGCNRVFWTERQLVAEFEHIIGLTSYYVQNLPDPNALGCVVQTEKDKSTTCTPTNGGFTVSAKPGTSAVLLEQTTASLMTMVQDGMDSGLYESEIMLKVVYIGDRRNFFNPLGSAPPENTQAHVNKSSNKKLIGTLLCLFFACLLLVCYLNNKRAWRDWRSDRYGNDEEVALGKYNSKVSRIRHTAGWSNMAPESDEDQDEDSHPSFEEGSDSRDSRDYSDSSYSGDPSEWTGDSSEGDCVNDYNGKVSVRDGGVGYGAYNRYSYVERIPAGYSESVDTTTSNSLYDRKERQRRLEHARIRAAQRKSLDSRSSRD